MQNTIDREVLNNIHRHHRAYNSLIGKKIVDRFTIRLY